MYCMNCGAKNLDGRLYCTSCGAPLAHDMLPEDGSDTTTDLTSIASGVPTNDAAGTVWDSAMEHEDNGSEDSQSGRGGRARVLIGICSIMAVVAIAALALFLASEHPQQSQVETETAAKSTTAKPVTLEFKGGEGSKGMMSSLEATGEETVIVPECSYTLVGHMFECWVDDDGNTYQPGQSITLRDDTQLTAKWVAEKCTIKFLGAGADAGSMDSVVVDYGSKVVLPVCDFTRDGYEFDGWVDEVGAIHAPGESITANGDASLTVQWKAHEKKAAPTAEAPAVQVPAAEAPYTTTTTDLSHDAVVTGSQSKSLSVSTLPREWVGAYEGFTTHTDEGVIERAVSIDLTNVSSNGNLQGVCYVGEREMIEGATHGSYYVSGTIDWESGWIHLWGTDWLDQGGLIGMGGFRGTVDLANRTMSGEWYDPEGEASPGDWFMRAA